MGTPLIPDELPFSAEEVRSALGRWLPERDSRWFALSGHLLVVIHNTKPSAVRSSEEDIASWRAW